MLALVHLGKQIIVDSDLFIGAFWHLLDDAQRERIVASLEEGVKHIPAVVITNDKIATPPNGPRTT